MRVGEGAELTIEPVAATVALPGPAVTRLELDVEVGDGARLVLEDAPLVVAEGADVLRTVTRHARPRRGAVAARHRRARPRRRGSRAVGAACCAWSGPDGVLLHDALRIEPAAEDAYVALAPGHRAVGTVVAVARQRRRAVARRARRARPARRSRRTASARRSERPRGGEPLEYGGRLWRVSAVSAADVEAQLPAVR